MNGTISNNLTTWTKHAVCVNEIVSPSKFCTLKWGTWTVIDVERGLAPAQTVNKSGQLFWFKRRCRSLTWSDDENVAKACAGVDDGWALGHGLCPPLRLKSLSHHTFTTITDVLLHTLTPHTSDQNFNTLFYLFVCPYDHLLLFNSDLGQKNKEGNVTVLPFFFFSLLLNACPQHHTDSYQFSTG